VRAARREVGGRRVGSLEAQVLEVLWRVREPVSASDLLAALGGRRRAYTTIVTVLGRLVDKGLVERLGEARHYRYRAAGDPDELTARAIEELLEAARDRHAVLAHLVQRTDDPELLAELAAILEARRA
jgi:predicted transcriptional regulator